MSIQQHHHGHEIVDILLKVCRITDEIASLSKLQGCFLTHLVRQVFG